MCLALLGYPTESIQSHLETKPTTIVQAARYCHRTVGRQQWEKVVHNTRALLPVIRTIPHDRQYHINHSFTENVPQTKCQCLLRHLAEFHCTPVTGKKRSSGIGCTPPAHFKSNPARCNSSNIKLTDASFANFCLLKTCVTHNMNVVRCLLKREIPSWYFL